VRTWKEAIAWLAERDIAIEQRSGGLYGRMVDGPRTYAFVIGRSSGGGDEMSVRLEGQPLTSWFQHPTLQGIVEMAVAARDDVREGRGPTWLDALRRLQAEHDARTQADGENEG
jgi:hypothetical protein